MYPNVGSILDSMYVLRSTAQGTTETSSGKDHTQCLQMCRESRISREWTHGRRVLRSTVNDNAMIDDTAAPVGP
jgi:hypothetical protein